MRGGWRLCGRWRLNLWSYGGNKRIERFIKREITQTRIKSMRAVYGVTIFTIDARPILASGFIAIVSLGYKLKVRGGEAMEMVAFV